MNKPLSILIASDSFKGSASTIEVAEYLSNGINRVIPKSHIETLPIADGGEGTVEAVTNNLNGTIKSLKVTGPLGNQVEAKYGLISQTTAIIEVAETSGLTLISENDLDPYITTSYGLGELMLHLIDNGVHNIYIGLGGSATNDGGLGMAQALGATFKDGNGNEIEFGGNNIDKIKQVDLNELHKKITGVSLEVLSDVQNPLIGKNGATYTYSGQKGASEEDKIILEKKMCDYQETIKLKTGIDLSAIKGGGAAGGLGAALWGFCNAKMNSGIGRILELLNLRQAVKNADLVITGEGNMDKQSLYGKAPIGIANVAKEFDKDVIAIVGAYNENDISDIYGSAIDLILSITSRPMTLQYSMENTKKLLENAGETAIRAYLLGNKNI